MAKRLWKVVQNFKQIKISSKAAEILNEVQAESLKQFPNEGMELIKLASTNFTGNEEVFEILESPKFFNAYSDSYFSWYLQLLTDNKLTYMSPQFYEALENKIIKMPINEIPWKLVSNALRIFGKFWIQPSHLYISKLEEIIINNKYEFGLGGYSNILNFYANLRLLEHPQHKNPKRFREEVLIKRDFSQSDLEKKSAMNSLIGLGKALLIMHHFQDTDLWKNNFKMLSDVFHKWNSSFAPLRINTELSLLQIIDAHQTFAPENIGKYEEYLNKIKNRCKVNRQNLNRSHTASPFEEDLQGLFKKYSLKYENHKIINDYYPVDFFIEPNIIIEYDGPIHYIRKYNEKTKMLKGNSVFKSELMIAKGYRVIRIPYYIGDHKAYLANELQKIGVLDQNS